MKIPYQIKDKQAEILLDAKRFVSNDEEDESGHSREGGHDEISVRKESAKVQG